MKYTKEYTTKKGRKRWRFVTPDDVREANIMHPAYTFRDGRTARFEIPKLIAKVEAFRRGDIVGDLIDKDSKLRHVAAHYLNSKDFLNLAPVSQKQYEKNIRYAMDFKLSSKKFGDIKLSELTVRACKELYDKLSEDRTPIEASTSFRHLSVVMHYAMSLDILLSNPIARVKKTKVEPKNIVWTREQVEDTLEAAFKEYKYRNVGLAVLMCYEWAQRPTDIYNLKWSSVDFENRMVTIKQSKRGAEVYLPLGDELLAMLKQQKEGLGFQEYVIPKYRRLDKAYVPYGNSDMAKLLHEVQEKAGVPTYLQMGYLRKTAIGEMVEARLDSTLIMQVTGHRNISSLNPYMKNTYSGAKAALDARRENKNDR